MKVSAPQFMSSSAPPTPDATTPSDAPADPSLPPAPPKPATWPGWFHGLDNMLLVCALLFAFMISSFAARNPDIFRHIATGQRLLAGKYSLGSDPLSYTGVDRPWVNQNWLFDLTLYLLYSMDSTGAVAVVLKAVLFAASFGVLLWFRRAGQSGWPWAFLIVMAALASSTVALLRPLVFGMFFFSMLLLVVFQGDWQNRAGRMLAFVGGIVWLWGGFDTYVILAPLVLGVMGVVSLIFAFIDSAAEKPVAATAPVDGSSTEPAAAEPAPVAARTFLPAPPAKFLLLAAAVSLLAMMLNPTFLIGATKSPAFALAQLVPAEFSLEIAEIFAEDQEYKFNAVSLLSSQYWDLEVFGKNIASLGLFLIVILGAIAISVGFGQPPISMIALWFVTLACSMLSFRLLPFFLLAAIPLVSGILNAISGWFPLTTEDDSRSRALIASSRLGRILTVPLFLLMILATIPGVLNPRHLDPLQTRRIDWRISPDDAFVRGVKQLQEWRSSGELPDHIRGLHINPEFGDYAALFAPDEKVFVNTRFRFHSPELSDLASIRTSVLWPPAPKQNEPRPLPNFNVGDKYNVSYLVVGRPNRPIEKLSLLLSLELVGVRESFVDSVWQLDGRTMILGRSNTQEVLALNQKLHIDPVKMAFGPQTVLPEGPAVNNKKEDAGWLGELLEVPPPPKNYMNDVAVLLDLGVLISQQDEARTIEERANALAAATGIGVIVLHPKAVPARAITEQELAIPLVAIRSARFAVYQTPDDETAYFNLARAYATPRLPEYKENDLKNQRLTALVRFLIRVPDPDKCPTRLLQSVIEGYFELILLQFDMKQFDSARESMKKLSSYIEVTPFEAQQTGGLLWQMTANAARRFSPLYDKLQQLTQERDIFSKDEFSFEEQAKKSGRNEPPSISAFVKKFDQAISRVVVLLNDGWEKSTKSAGLKPGSLALSAMQFGLHNKAISLLERARTLSPAESGLRSPVDAELALLTLSLELGRLEEADKILQGLESQSEGMPDYVRQQVLQLKLEKLVRQGSYAQAVQALDDLRAPNTFQKLNENERLLVRYRPDILSLLLSSVAGPVGALVPQFQPPQGTAPEAMAAMQAAFIKNTARTHPILVGNMLRQALFAESNHFYQRGVLALYAGDMKIAQESFERSLAPQGIPLPFIVNTLQEALQMQGRSLNMNQLMPSFLFVPHYLGMINRFQPPKNEKGS